MTKIRSSDKHEAPRRKGHERVDAFAKTHMRGLEALLKSKREMLKQKAARLLHRRHNHGRKADKHSRAMEHQYAETATAISNAVNREVATRVDPGRVSWSASKGSRPAANDKEFYQHLDQQSPLNDDDDAMSPHFEDEITWALQQTRLSGTDEGSLVSSNGNFGNDDDCAEQARLEEALEASGRELMEREEEIRTLKMALRLSVEDQGGVKYHTYEAVRKEQGQGDSNGGNGAGAVVEYVYNPDEDGETSMMGSLRVSKVPGDDDPPPYTPF